MATGNAGGFSVDFAEDLDVDGKSLGGMLFRERPKAEFVSMLYYMYAYVRVNVTIVTTSCLMRII